jgi:hypothetical protein
VRAVVTWTPALVVLLLDASASFAGARPGSDGEALQHVSATATSAMIVPLRLSRHFPIIVATIDGLDVPLVLDSGDQSTVALQQSVLDKIKAVPTSESTQLQFAKGPTVKSAKFRIPRLQIGQTVFTDVIGRLDVHDPSYQATDVGQKGFFGTGLLKPYEVVLDYRNRTMTLIPRESSEGPSESCRGTAVPFASKEAPGEPVTEVDTDLGKFLAWWDTGSPISAISKRFVEGARPNQSEERLKTRRFIFGGRNFGPWTLTVADITLPPWFSGFIGYNFFASHVVCMNFPGKQIVIRGDS